MPGVVRGQIKVDAHAAAAKIRDHLLSDLDLYATEIARAASAFGATWLDLGWDADDVTVTFDGHFPTVEQIARARDYVLGADSDEHAAGLRLLGIGISAALGLDPAFVDVLVAEPDGVRQIRFQRDDEGAPSVATLEQSGLALGSLRVQVRRRLGLEVLRRALRPDPPRAVRHVIERAWPSALRMSMHGAPISSATVTPLGATTMNASPFRASVELLPAHIPRGSTVFVERGIALVTGHFVGQPADEDTLGLPIRVVVEADRLPTNASRSMIRLETPALARLFGQLAAAVDELVLEASRAPSDPDRRNALGALAAWVVRRRRAGHASSAPLTALLDEPFLQDAFGRALTLHALEPRVPAQPLVVYTGDEPLEAALASAFPLTVWLRGGPAERALAGVATIAARDLVPLARTGMQKRARALRRADVPVAVPISTQHVHRERFAVTEGAFRGLSGEIALGPVALSIPPCRVHWFLDGQRFETTQEVRQTDFALELALAWDGSLQTDLGYEHVQRTSRREAAVAYAHCVAAVVVLDRFAATDPELGRAAIRTWLRAAGELAVKVTPETLPAALVEAPLWACSDGTHVALTALRDSIRRVGVICTSRDATERAPDGRPVLLEGESALWKRLLPDAKLVAYGHLLAGPSQWPVRDPQLSVAFERGDSSGYLTPGTGQIKVYHAGKCRLQKPYRSRFGHVDIIVDAPTLVPRPNGDGFFGRMALGAFKSLERDLLEHVLRQVEAGAFDAVAPPHLLAYVAEAQAVEEGRRSDARSSRGVASAKLDASCQRLEAQHRRLARVKLVNLRTAFLAKPVEGPASVPPRHAYVKTDSKGNGSVAVSMRATTMTRTLFQGRALDDRPFTDLPVAAVADVERQDFVNGTWTGLNEDGLTWVRKATVLAALELLRRRLELPAALDDEGVLRLAAAACRDSRTRVAQLLAATRWPTVDGGSIALGTELALRFGEDLHVEYRHGPGESTWDQPCLHLPRGPIGVARRALLLALGYELVDVTAALARVQNARARSGGDTISYADTLGRSHPLPELLARGDVHYTTDVEHRGLALEADDRPILLLEPLRVADLRAWIHDTDTRRVLRDVTRQLDQERLGAQRRSAKALDVVELTTEMRAQCTKTVRFTWKAERLRGELGLLRGEHAGARGLWLFSRGRPLCRIDDHPDGMPTLARIDIGGLATTTAFDGLSRFGDEDRIRRLIANAARLEARPPPLPAVPPPLPAVPPPVPMFVDVSVPVLASAPTITVEAVLVEAPDTPSFFAHLWRRAQDLVRPAPLLAPSSLQFLAERLDAFGLPGMPVATIAAAAAGRPLRFDHRERRIVVNLRHGSVRPLLTRAASMHLALAAVSEINRELVSVSDAHERELVCAALRQLAASEAPELL